MIVANAMLECVNEAFLGDVVEMRLEVLGLNVEELVLLAIGEAVDEDVSGRQSALLPVRHEDDDGLCRSVFVDGEVGWFGHREHERREVWDGEALHVDVHVEWPCAATKSEARCEK